MPVNQTAPPKPKPSIDDLLNQIYEWRERATAELRRYERFEAAKIHAKEIFS